MYGKDWEDDGLKPPKCISGDHSFWELTKLEFEGNVWVSGYLT